MKLNLGCGFYPLEGYVNVDADPSTPAQLHVSVPPVLCADEAADEIYCGHLLEHLTPPEAHALLRDCHRALRRGGRLAVVVPDTRAIVQRYLAGDATLVDYNGQAFRIADLDHVCALFFYSTVQPSRHQWSYDSETLARALLAAGFEGLVPLDRFADPRISCHVWYGCGWEAVKP